MARTVNMKEWRCPKCKSEVEAVASAVSHRCPSNKNIYTAYELINEGK